MDPMNCFSFFTVSRNFGGRLPPLDPSQYEQKPKIACQGSSQTGWRNPKKRPTNQGHHGKPDEVPKPKYSLASFRPFKNPTGQEMKGVKTERPKKGS
jgi:hypothetical protein